MAEIDIHGLVKREYKDISLSFARNPITRDILAVTGEDAVKRAIKNLLLTQTGEVPFFPNYGSRIRQLLFEPSDVVTSTLLQNEIEATIHGFEPRVAILSLTVKTTQDDLAYEVNLVLRLLNQTTPVTLTVILTRLR